MKKVYSTIAIAAIAGSLGGYFLFNKKGGSDRSAFVKYCNTHIEMPGKAASIKQLKRKSKANTCGELYDYVVSRGSIQLGSVIEVESLKYFTSITSMELDALGEIDLSVLDGTKNLASLTIFSSFDQPSIKGLKQFLDHSPRLEKLALGNVIVPDEKGLLDGNSSMKTIEISEAQINSLETFGQLPQLERLSIPFSAINSLQGIDKFPSLQELIVTGTKVKDLHPLESLKKLRNLDLSFTEVVDVKPLEKLTTLEQIALEKNANADNTAQIQCPESTRNPALSKLCSQQHISGKQANL